MRVLKWVIDRVQGRGYGVESPWGSMPRHQDIEWRGLEFDPETFYQLMSVDKGEAAIEVRSHEELFDKFFDRLPKEFVYHRQLFKSRVWRSPQVWELARAIF
jgi:phosphoenolpyruvate carboxykinase (GTP)